MGPAASTCGGKHLNKVFFPSRQKRATQARREMEAVEEGEDTNHIMVLTSNGASNPTGDGGGGDQGPEKPGFQRPKPRMQVEIR